MTMGMHMVALRHNTTRQAIKVGWDTCVHGHAMVARGWQVLREEAMLARQRKAQRLKADQSLSLIVHMTIARPSTWTWTWTCHGPLHAHEHGPRHAHG